MASDKNFDSFIRFRIWMLGLGTFGLGIEAFELILSYWLEFAKNRTVGVGLTFY